jgi:lysophospholipase L1-like esterase
MNYMRNVFLIGFLASVLSAVSFAQGSGTTAATTAPSSITADQLTRLERAENRLKDWPNIARYHDANEKLAPPAKDEQRVVFMGDSITDGWKLNEYFPGKPFVNRGISGQTTPQMLIRFRPDVLALKPRVVVILAGTNDLAGNTGPMTIEAIEGNLQSMAELARANGIRVVMSSIMPVSDYAKNKEGAPINQTVRRPPEKILAVNQWIKRYAQENDLVYLDYFSPMADEKGFFKAELSGDGLHPNQKGYEVMKPLAEAAINTALKMKSKK